MKFLVPEAFCQFLEQLEVPIDALLAQAHLTGRLVDGQITLSPLEYYQLLAVAEPHISTKQILQACDVEQMTKFSTPVYAALMAENGLASLQRLAKYKHLIGPVTMTVQDLGEQVAIHYEFIYPEMSQLQIALLFEQLLAANLVRTGSGKTVVPLKVASPFPYPDVIQAHLGLSGEFSKTNDLIFAKADLLRPFDTANNPLWEAMLPKLQAQLAENDAEDPLMASVQETLMTNIARADDSLASVGAQLGMSPRSLQREFGRRNTTYKKLLAHAKQMLAINYVRNFHLPLAEVAYLLGYSEPSAFSRAFRQWTGVPFSKYQSLQA